MKARPVALGDSVNIQTSRLEGTTRDAVRLGVGSGRHGCDGIVEEEDVKMFARRIQCGWWAAKTVASLTQPLEALQPTRQHPQLSICEQRLRRTSPNFQPTRNHNGSRRRSQSWNALCVSSANITSHIEFPSLSQQPPQTSVADGSRTANFCRFSRDFKKKGYIALSTYLRQYKVGDIVDVVANGMEIAPETY
jgi:hypothetical protein